MSADALAIEAAFNVCLAMTKKGVPRKEARAAFSRHLGPAPIRKAGDNGPGAHNIPEIAAREKAFHDIVMGGGEETLKMLKQLVEQLYVEGRGFDSIDPYAFDEPLEQWKNKAIIELATHPLQAFLLGQLFATELAKKPVMRPLQPDDRKAVEFLQMHAFNEISSKFDEIKGDIRHEVIRGVESGENPREVARRLSNKLNDYESDFGLIAITEVSRAENQGRLKEFLDQGIEFCEGSSANDSRLCDDCRRLIDGKIYRVADIINNNNYGKKRDDWQPCAPLHPACRCTFLPSDG